MRKNLTKLRSELRWRLSYLAMSLIVLLLIKLSWRLVRVRSEPWLMPMAMIEEYADHFSIYQWMLLAHAVLITITIMQLYHLAGAPNSPSVSRGKNVDRSSGRRSVSKGQKKTTSRASR